MRKILFLFTLIISVLLMFSCLEDSETGNSKETESNIMDTTGTIDDCVVNIKAMRLTVDYEDEPAVIITYDYTNNSAETKSFMIAFTDKVFQDGIQCERAISNYNDDSYSSDNQLKEIKTGATLEVEAIYKLNNATSDIEVEISKFISFSKDDPIVTRTFSLNG